MTTTKTHTITEARKALGLSQLQLADKAGISRAFLSYMEHGYELTSTRELPAHRDGRRVLYHRDELDCFVRDGGATCP